MLFSKLLRQLFILLAIIALPVLSCKKHTRASQKPAAYTPWFYTYAGKYQGIQTDYNFSNGTSSSHSAEVSLTLLKTGNADTMKLYLDGNSMYFNTRTTGFWYPWDQSTFGFQFTNGDTVFHYGYYGGPGINSYLLKSFTGKKTK